MKNRFSLIIFDCDGVLVDSERPANQVIADMVGELGLTMSVDEAISRFRGGKMADCVAGISKLLGRELPENFTTEFRARSAEAFRNGLSPVPGVEAALDRIATPTCVASSGPREKIQLTLSLTGLLSRFEGRIFSAYEINSWKPSPDLFLHAARTLGVSPEACAVVEDSTLGVRAGIAAGMQVFAYAPTPEVSFEDFEATVFQDMAELPPLLSH